MKKKKIEKLKTKSDFKSNLKKDKSKLPPLKSWQKIALLGISLFIILVIEGICRLSGYGGHNPLFLKLLKKADGSYVYRTNPKAAELFFLSKSKGNIRIIGEMQDERIPVPKPKNGLRIFFVGESTVEGYPYPPNLCSSAFLNEMLKKALPEKEVQVINLGITGIASYPVLKITEQAMEYEPDLVIVYAGHNEYFGAFGVASLQSVGTAKWQLKGIYWLRGLGIYQALLGIIDKFSSKSTEGETRKELIQIMAKTGNIPMDSKLRKRAIKNLSHHLKSITKICKKQKVPIILCTLVSNEHDMAPLHSPNLNKISPSQAQIWEKNFQLGIQNLSKEDTHASKYFQLAFESNPNHGLTHYYYAQALEQSGDTTSALQHYIQARDLDEMPWRVAETTNQIIRSLATEENVWLNDVEHRFHQIEPLGIGWKLMADHLHPSMEGQVLLAQTIYDTLSSHHWMDIHQSKSMITTNWEMLSRQMGNNRMEEFEVASRMWTLFQNPPLNENNEKAHLRFLQIGHSIESSSTVIEQKIIQDAINNNFQGNLTIPTAEAYMKAKMFGPAKEYFRCIWMQKKEYTLEKLRMAYSILYCSKMEHNQLTDKEIQFAKEHLNQAKELVTNGLHKSQEGAYYQICGYLSQIIGSYQESLEFFNKSLEFVKGMDRQKIAISMSESYISLNRIDYAKKILQQELHSTTWNGPEQMLNYLESRDKSSP